MLFTLYADVDLNLGSEVEVEQQKVDEGGLSEGSDAEVEMEVGDGFEGEDQQIVSTQQTQDSATALAQELFNN